MKSIRVLSICALAFLMNAGTGAAQDKTAKAPPRPGLTLTTPAFNDGAEIPSKYTQSVSNRYRPNWNGLTFPRIRSVSSCTCTIPTSRCSIQRTTCCTGWCSIFPATLTNFPKACRPVRLPDGAIQLKNGGNTVGYRGPGAPAAGPHHHYTFELLRTRHEARPGTHATRAEVLKAIDGHVLGKGVMVGRFHR